MKETVARLAIAMALVTLAGVGGAAIWVPMSLQDLVSQSQLIVVGEVVSTRPQSGTAKDIATIKVDELLRSNPVVANVPQAEVLMPSARGLLASDTIVYKVGQRGIWFLKRDPASKDAFYLADHPHRLKAVSELADVRNYLKANPAK